MVAAICFSGSIGSGKSSVSKIVASRLKCKRAGFGDLVRSMVEQNGGDPTSRSQLQDFGQACVESDARAFCKELLDFVGFESPEQIVVDGIRHGRVFQELVDVLSPQPSFLLHLAVDSDVRTNRIAKRDGSTDELADALGHPVEMDAEHVLPSMADQLINANQPSDRVVDDVLRAISKLSS